MHGLIFPLYVVRVIRALDATLVALRRATAEVGRARAKRRKERGARAESAKWSWRAWS
jgi:hypothetical protein